MVGFSVKVGRILAADVGRDPGASEITVRRAELEWREGSSQKRAADRDVVHGFPKVPSGIL